MNKLTRELAIAEFEKWFESKKLPGTKRAENNPDAMDGIEKEMIMAFQEGRIIVNDDMTLTMFLQMPLENNGNKLTELVFAHRIQAGKIQSRTAHVKPNDLQGRILFTIAALTDQEGGIIRALYDVDYNLASNIATYFF